MGYKYFGPIPEIGGGGTLGFVGKSDLDMKGHKVTNMGHPTQEGDAVSLKYITKEIGAAKRGPKGEKGNT